MLKCLIPEVERLGVAIRMDTEASADLIAAERPDAVIVATGATPIAPEISGDGSVPVSTSARAVLAGMLPGESVVVMDEDAPTCASSATPSRRAGSPMRSGKATAPAARSSLV